MSLNIAIIPARGGSKRLPGKNIKNLNGKPLIAWTIEAAISSGVFDDIYVSTDSKEIADISVKYGATVPFLRPESLATDEATTNDVVYHLIDWLEKTQAHKKISNVAILQPTSPLRTKSDIVNALSLYSKKMADSVVSVCELEHPYQYANKIDSSLGMKDFISQESCRRTQELDVYYRLNGAIYFFNRDRITNLNQLYGDNSFAYIMPSYRSIDIDSYFDFDLVEYILLKSNLKE
ncbi:acylneuraminate cytidylyltransferase family protein [Photorhabdus tasmaniensis]|uniref:acylneuraminate cytidylyltransferase family protein n=1 Tax=Photorhabdus tasmaniensis TaxID=1004159 RepID=UPI00404282CB